MKKFKFLSGIAVLCLFVFSCSSDKNKTSESNINESADTQQVQEQEVTFGTSEIKDTGVNKTALKLYKEINEEKGKENIFFSPYSIRTAFGMLYEGAQGNTAKELENIFAF
ncbi:MAG: hypothetical protein FWH43_07690, partial [Endomicrobia bacterium]|nr:hypothetical protein [Endomicrobiia bacterium]